MTRRDLEDDDVGVDLVRIDAHARDARQPGGEAARVRVIVGEPVAVVLERVQRGGAQDADLAHAAAQHLAEAARAFDVVARPPAITEPTGAPSPFEKQAETVSNGAASSPLRDAARDGGVPDARAVEVQREAAPARARHDRATS